jgi:hypothetical protein
MEIMDSCYYLPLLDGDDDLQVVCAYGVDEITTVTRTMLSQRVGDIFPMIRAFMPWVHTEDGPVDLLIRLDNRQWLSILSYLDSYYFKD